MYNLLPPRIKRKFKVTYNIQVDDNLTIFENKEKKWGMLAKVSRFGFVYYKTLVKPMYNSMGHDQNLNLIKALKYTNDRFDDGVTHYFFDLQGKLTAEVKGFMYLHFDRFSNLIGAKKGDTWMDRTYGILDTNFNEIIPAVYTELHCLGDNLFKARTRDGRYGIIDIHHTIVLDFAYTYIFDLCKDQRVIVEKSKENYAVFDIGKKTFQPLPYSKILYASSNTYKAPTAESHSFYKTISEMQETDYTTYEMSHYKGKWGIISADGRVLIPDEYDYIDFLRNPGYFKVAKGHFEFEYAGEDNELVAKNIKWGVIDSYNRIIVPIKYDWVEEVEDTIWLVNEGGTVYYNDEYQEDYWDAKGGKSGAFNMQKLIVPVEYDKMMINFGRVKDYIFVKNGKEYFFGDESYDVFDFNGNKITGNKPNPKDHLAQ